MSFDPKQPIDLTQGNTAEERGRGRGARRVFHGTLAAELNDRGAATVEELELRFVCFLLPLNEGEIRQVLESARREGFVTEVSGQRDGWGGEVSGQWATTEAGRKLRRPRALALPDLGYRLVGESDGVVKAFDWGKTAVGALVPALALLGISEWDATTTAKWAAFVGVGVVIVWALYYAIKGELDLRAAAASWQRLEDERPERWQYQMSWPCMLCLPLALVTTYIAVGAALVLEPFAWWVYGIAAVVLAASLGLFYLIEVHPLYRAWHSTDPDRCRTGWKERSNARLQAIGAATAAAGSGGGEAA